VHDAPAARSAAAPIRSGKSSARIKQELVVAENVKRESVEEPLGSQRDQLILWKDGGALRAEWQKRDGSVVLLWINNLVLIWYPAPFIVMDEWKCANYSRAGLPSNLPTFSCLKPDWQSNPLVLVPIALKYEWPSLLCRCTSPMSFIGSQRPFRLHSVASRTYLAPFVTPLHHSPCNLLSLFSVPSPSSMLVLTGCCLRITNAQCCMYGYAHIRANNATGRSTVLSNRAYPACPV
jgi:hypothetical protein